MSFREATAPACADCSGAIELRVEAKDHDIGGLVVRRVLPTARRRMVGPFIFFDHFGPAEFPPGKGINVRPHPHIGLATISYLFAGQIMHRDSLGYSQLIEAGAVNLMSAGRGIVHSERAGDDLERLSDLHGLQTWIALPDDQQEIDPDFLHYPASDLPETEIKGVTVRMIIGEAYGLKSPVRSYSPTLYMACAMPQGSTLALPNSYSERAVYVVDGSVQIENETCEAAVLAIAHKDREVVVSAREDSRIMVFGGEPLGKRHIWWNFVSTSKERIEQAKQDWKAGAMGSIDGDAEFMPLPE